MYFNVRFRNKDIKRKKNIQLNYLVYREGHKGQLEQHYKEGLSSHIAVQLDGLDQGVSHNTAGRGQLGHEGEGCEQFGGRVDEV